MTEHSKGYGSSASEEASTTRRGILKNQLKALVAFGATVLTTQVSKAGYWNRNEHGHGREHEHEHGHGHGGPCFLRGTKLRAADGECKVEDVAVGDRLLTASGPYREVQWVGRWQARKQRRERWSDEVRPVRIKRSALARNVPYEDLYVTRGHAIFIDNVLVPAGELVNGATIVLHEANETDELEYFHVKIASHDVIFAAGAPTETLLRYPDSVLDPANVGDVRRESHCAPILANGGRKRLLAQVRGWGTPLLGPQKLDVIRRRLADQAGCG